MENKTGPKGADYLKNVERFVQDQGDRMVYHVGADGPEGLMEKAWYKPSGAQGIPTAFIVNGEGTIVWMGHPKDLEEVLPRTLDGSWNLKQAALKEQQRREHEQKVRVVAEPYFKALRAKEWAAAEKAGQALFQPFPDMERGFGYTYYSVLAHLDPARADAYAATLLDRGYKDNPDGLVLLVGAMLETPGRTPDLPVAYARKAVALPRGKDNFYAYSTLGRALAKAGKVDEGLAIDEKALALAAADPKISEAWVKEVRERIQAAKAARKG
jgi:hypothetical protein